MGNKSNIIDKRKIKIQDAHDDEHKRKIATTKSKETEIKRLF